ncbi:MAG TPA: hypothetical protein VL358_08580 [Caulobacteraceae bacterium]|jgi:hypothetical protein|nr:hypothetical protein [Caulobacteraceae bacterium]
MKNHPMIRRTLIALAAAALLSPTLAAAQGPAAPAAQPPRTPKAAAPIDLTGNWVSIVNEDWLYRMVTPKKGDFPGLPLTKAAQDAANAWDPATDGSCKAYGVGGIMRMPGRLRIGWAADDALKIETDAGVQTRLLVFGKRPDANTPATLQGFSVARWEFPNPVLGQAAVPGAAGGGLGGGPGARAPGGDLMVVTTNTTGGWVRRNGVPYSPNTKVTEYFDRFKGPDGAEWLTVLTAVDDPANFNGPYLTSTHFKKEPDGSKWRPRPCTP